MRMLYRVFPAALVLIFATPTLAKDTFYIVQDKAKKTCTVVKEKPKTDTMMIVGDGGMMFTTQADAEAAVKKTKVCVTK
jgi:hypothetical protein